MATTPLVARPSLLAAWRERFAVLRWTATLLALLFVFAVAWLQETPPAPARPRHSWSRAGLAVGRDTARQAHQRADGVLARVREVYELVCRLARERQAQLARQTAAAPGASSTAEPQLQ